MNITEGNRQLTQRGVQRTSIVDFEFNDYVLYIFPGDLSEFDILIKYKKGEKKIRTPKHIHWVVDMLLKMQKDNALTREFLLEIKNVWENSVPLQNREFETIKRLIEEDMSEIEIQRYVQLNNYGEYPVDFLFVLMKLLAVQEKTNRADAYMFGKIIDGLLETELDIFKVVSTAGFGGRR